MSEAIIAGLFTLAAAFFTVAYQVYASRNEKKQQEKDTVTARKMAIISDIVSCRYVLTGGPGSTLGVFHFNSALNRIPIEFIDHPEVIHEYRTIGNKFDAERFFRLVMTMLKVTREVPSQMDINLLEQAPSAKSLVSEFSFNLHFDGVTKDQVRVEPRTK